MSKTPLSDIYSGAQSFLQLQGRLLQLKYARTITDTVYSGLRSGGIIILGLTAALFFSVALAMWLGELLHSIPAGFAFTGGFYLLTTAVWAGTWKRRGNGVKDTVVRKLDIGLTTFEDLEREHGELKQKVAYEKEVLLSRLEELKQAIADIEGKFGGKDKSAEGDETPRTRLSNQVLSTTLNVLLDAFVLPKVGIVKRAVLPFVANAVIRSKFFKSGKLGAFLSKIRSRG